MLHTTPIFSAPAAGFLGLSPRKCPQTVYKSRFCDHITVTLYTLNTFNQVLQVVNDQSRGAGSTHTNVTYIFTVFSNKSFRDVITTLHFKEKFHFFFHTVVIKRSSVMIKNVKKIHFFRCFHIFKIFLHQCLSNNFWKMISEFVLM